MFRRVEEHKPLAVDLAKKMLSTIQQGTDLNVIKMAICIVSTTVDRSSTVVHINLDYAIAPRGTEII